MPAKKIGPARVQDKYGVFWYNDREILHWKQKDFDAKAAEFAETGINIVMTFSCTHFRWDYYPWWKQINQALAKLVKACHKYHIRVVEHHSSHLTKNPRSFKEWRAVEQSLAKRHSSPDMFPGLRNHIASGDPEIRPGVHLSDCRQIDGRTGDFARTNYIGYGHCVNNPHYRAAYFDYLESVYRTGVDGIMTDDVGYKEFNYNVCTCRYCWEKFKEKTGYELPGPEKWSQFHDFRNPVFLAWLKFRMDSTNEFQRAVSEHARKLGYKMLRPNYETSTFKSNWTAYPFEAVGDLWSCVFQENMFSIVIHTGWPSWACDAAHRLAMAGRYGIMSMSMFYPARYDDYYFCWALAKAWNQLLMATPEGGDLNQIEKKFCAYDRENPILENPDSVADAAFLEPRTSMDYTEDYSGSSVRPFSVWIQSAVFRNLQRTVLFEDQSPDEWKRHPFIVIAGATMLSDDLLNKIKLYCEQGGRLLLFGAFGMFKPDGTIRKQPGKIFGIEAELGEFIPVSRGQFNWNGKTVKLPPVAESRTFTKVNGRDVQIVAEGENGEIFGISAMNGNLIWLAGGVRSRNPESAHYGKMIPRWGNQNTQEEAPPYAADYLAQVPGAILELLLPRPKLIQCSGKDHMATFFMDREHRKGEIHIVNVAGTLYKPPAKVSHADPLPNFLPDAPKYNRDLQITLHLPQGFRPSTNIEGRSPELKKKLHFASTLSGPVLKIRIPAGTFAGYLKLTLK